MIPASWSRPVLGAKEFTTVTYKQTANGVTYADARGTVGGEPVALVAPSGEMYDPAAPLVLWHHGHGDSETTYLTSTWDGIRQTLIENGYIVVTTDAGGPSWGNPGALDAYDAALTWARALYPDAGNTLLLAFSMGTVPALLRVAQDRSPVAAVAAISGVCSLNAVYGNVNLAPTIETAYGFTGGWDDTATAGHDPLGDYAATDYTGTAFRFYASPSDTAVVKSENTDPMNAMLTGGGVTSSVVAATGGHVDPSLFQPTDLLTFFEAHR